MEKELSAPIVEIFRSLEGEGAFIGVPTIFIRLAGCDVGCTHCDSRQTWSTANYEWLTVLQVLTKVESIIQDYNIQRISITGGEPLLHETFVLDFIKSLTIFDPYLKINLETSGTKFPSNIFGKGIIADYFDEISMDIKTPSSGVVLSSYQKSCIQEYCSMEIVYTKAVIGSKKDLEFVLDLLDGVDVNNLVLTPCEIKGSFFPIEDMFEVFQERSLYLSERSIRIIGQQHKFLGYR